MSDWSKEQRARLREVLEDHCSCGGDGPGDCCDVCEVYHALEVGKAPVEARTCGEYPVCPECGALCHSVDEDGCCSACGVDVFFDDDGNPRPENWKFLDRDDPRPTPETGETEAICQAAADALHLGDAASDAGDLHDEMLAIAGSAPETGEVCVYDGPECRQVKKWKCEGCCDSCAEVAGKWVYPVGARCPVQGHHVGLHDSCESHRVSGPNPPPGWKPLADGGATDDMFADHADRITALEETPRDTYLTERIAALEADIRALAGVVGKLGTQQRWVFRSIRQVVQADGVRQHIGDQPAICQDLRDNEDHSANLAASASRIADAK